MKHYIAMFLGLLAITITGCKDDDDHNLKAELEIRKFDSSQIELYLEEGHGEVSDTFQEGEEIAFLVNLTNTGLKTQSLTWSCHFSLIQIFDASNQLVYHTDRRPVGCSAGISQHVIYTGETITDAYYWDQELYTYNETDGLVQTGEYLTPGEYTVVSYVSIGVGPFGNPEPVTIDMPEQTFVVEAATTE